MRLLFDDLGIKLVSLLVAVLVYLHVSTDREQALSMRLPLGLRDLSDSLMVTSVQPGHARVRLEGRGRDIYVAVLQGARVEYSLKDAGPGKLHHVLTPHDVQIPGGLGVRASEVLEPETLEVHLERRSHRRLPVRVVASAGGAALDVRATPDSVDVEGPQSLMRAMEAVETAPVAHGAGGPGKEIRVDLRSPSNLVHLNPGQVRVRP